MFWFLIFLILVVIAFFTAFFEGIYNLLSFKANAWKMFLVVVGIMWYLGLPEYGFVIGACMAQDR